MQQTVQQQSRRTHGRYRIPRERKLYVSVARLGGPEDTCEVVDFGAGGIKIRSRQALYEGACVWVYMGWSESPQTVLGEVNRVRPDDDHSLVAIKFDTPLTQLAEVRSTLCI